MQGHEIVMKTASETSLYACVTDKNPAGYPPDISLKSLLYTESHSPVQKGRSILKRSKEEINVQVEVADSQECPAASGLFLL
jgi:hypothetical protein